MLGQNLNQVKNLLNEKQVQMEKGDVEPRPPLTTEEKQRMRNMVRQLEYIGESIYGRNNLKEMCGKLHEMVDTADRYIAEMIESNDLTETISAKREMKRVQDDYKMLEKTAQEMEVLSERIQRAYENLSYGMNRLFGE